MAKRRILGQSRISGRMTAMSHEGYFCAGNAMQFIDTSALINGTSLLAYRGSDENDYYDKEVIHDNIIFEERSTVTQSLNMRCRITPQ